MYSQEGLDSVYEFETVENTLDEEPANFVRKKTVNENIPRNEDLYCEKCQKNFITKSKKQKHTKRVHVEKKRNFFCKHCSKTFTRREHLAIHVKVLHDKIKDFSCNNCGNLFTDKYAMKKHERTHTRENNGRFCCKVCSKRFSRRQYMVGHINAVHERASSLYCELCDKYFTRKITLSYHQEKTHSGN